jgi:hypothetical protein
MRERGAHTLRREEWEVKSHISQETFEHGERRTTGRGVHLSGVKEGMHPKALTADIEQYRTAAKEGRTVWIC